MFKITLKIDGMACGMCESHINDTVRQNFAVKKVESSHTKGITQIISETPIGETELKSAIDKTGYKVLGMSTEPYEKKRFSFFKK